MKERPDWLLMEQVILSGQMSEADLQTRLRADPLFAVWLTERAKARQSR